MLAKAIGKNITKELINGIVQITAITAVGIVTIYSIGKQSSVNEKENDNMERKRQEYNTRIKKGKKNIEELINKKKKLEDEIIELEKRRDNLKKDSKNYIISFVNENL